MQEKNYNVILLLGPMQTGKTIISTIFNEYLSFEKIEIDLLYKYPIFSKVPDFNPVTYMQNISNSLLQLTYNHLAECEGFTVVDFGGLASFPQTEESREILKKLLFMYPNAFYILPDKEISKCDELLNKREVYNKNLSLLNQYNLQSFKDMINLFPNPEKANLNNIIINKSVHYTEFHNQRLSVVKEILQRCEGLDYEKLKKHSGEYALNYILNVEKNDSINNTTLQKEF